MIIEQRGWIVLRTAQGLYAESGVDWSVFYVRRKKESKGSLKNYLSCLWKLPFLYLTRLQTEAESRRESGNPEDGKRVMISSSCTSPEITSRQSFHSGSFSALPRVECSFRLSSLDPPGVNQDSLCFLLELLDTGWGQIDLRFDQTLEHFKTLKHIFNAF